MGIINHFYDDVFEDYFLKLIIDDNKEVLFSLYNFFNDKNYIKNYFENLDNDNDLFSYVKSSIDLLIVNSKLNFCLDLFKIDFSKSLEIKPSIIFDNFFFEMVLGSILRSKYESIVNKDINLMIPESKKVSFISIININSFFDFDSLDFDIDSSVNSFFVNNLNNKLSDMNKIKENVSEVTYDLFLECDNQNQFDLICEEFENYIKSLNYNFTINIKNSYLSNLKNKMIDYNFYIDLNSKKQDINKTIILEAMYAKVIVISDKSYDNLVKHLLTGFIIDSNNLICVFSIVNDILKDIVSRSHLKSVLDLAQIKARKYFKNLKLN
jgi:hypothetical protein